MIGAIIGDLAGSIYEYGQIKKVSRIEMKNLIEDNAFFSDDTILTMAILDAVLNNKDYMETLKEYAKNYMNHLPSHTPYFKTVFSPGFTSWVNGDYIGVSKGNGAMMRVSPIGYLFDSEEEVLNNAYLATMPSHNDKDSIKCAQIVALIIFYARKGMSKKEIIDKLKLKINKPEIKSFNYTCLDTIDVCLYSLFNSDSFEECIKTVLSFGGDTDTNACIVASMGEAIFGVSEELKNKAYEKIPAQFINLLKQVYK